MSMVWLVTEITLQQFLHQLADRIVPAWMPKMGLGADLNQIYLTGPRMRAFVALDMRRPADSEFADSVDLIEELGRGECGISTGHFIVA
jgi:hypothetical protein